MTNNTGRSRTPLAQSVEGVSRAFQRLISFIVGVAASLTAGGFVVVNSHLARYTDIHGYTLRPAQYLAAGVGLLVPPFLAIGIVAAAYYFGRFLGAVMRRRKPASPNDASEDGDDTGVLTPVVRTLDTWLLPESTRRLIFISGMILYTLLFGLVYGATIYGSVPRYLGGGQPQDIVLVFEDVSMPQLLNLTQDTTVPQRTGVVLLLAELNDGLLVVDTVNGQVATVKNESLLAVLDDVPSPQIDRQAPVESVPAQAVETATPTPAAMDTPMPTAIPFP